MTAILETIWATVVGGMLIVSILSGLFTIQTTAMNLEMQVSLNDISEEVTSILNNEILARVGSGVDPDSTMITTAKSNEFEFKGR
jgi:predicted aspartyl protease